MEEFPSNSRRQKESSDRRESKPRATRVVEGEVVRRKKPLGRKFKDLFFSGDAHGVWGYIAYDIIIPAVRDAISESFHEGFDRMWEGRSEPGRGRSRRRRDRGHTPYHRYSADPRERDREDRSISRRGRQLHDFDEIILPTRREAEEAIAQMFDIVEEYDAVTVEDLYRIVGIEPSYVDKKWGWYDIRGSGVTRIKGGYLLDLEKPEPLD